MTTYNGTNADDLIVGSGGNDLLSGKNGNDVLSGANGDDLLAGGNGDDILDGGDGNDVLEGGNGGDSLAGGSGDDVLAGGNGADQLDGGTGDDELTGGNGNDVLSGANGDDLLAGGNGDDILDGGDGNDVLAGGNGADQLDGGAGDDELTGGNGNDSLDGGAGSDQLSGQNGNDTLIYVVSQNAGQSDTFDGGAGNDTLRLVLTQAEHDSPAVQADLDAYRAFLAAAHAGSFSFSAFDLTVSRIERLEIIISQATTPTAVPDAASGGENEALLIDVLANDNSANPGATLNVVAASAPAGQGTAAVADGQVSFDPGTDFDYLGAGETATVVLNYAIENEEGGQASATVTVTVTGTNDAPVVGLGESGSQAEDNAIVLSAASLLANDLDPDQTDTLSIASVQDAVNGTVMLEGSNIVFTPAADFAGEASFTYTVTDGTATGAPVTVTLDISPVADAPALSIGQGDPGDAVGNGIEDAPVILPTISAALTDLDGSETLSLVLTGYPAGASFSLGHAVAEGWVIDDAAEIASLATAPLVMNPPPNYNGDFELLISARATDAALLSSGLATDLAMTSATIAVTIAAAADLASVTQHANGDFGWDIVLPAFLSPNAAFNVETSGAHDATSFTLRNLDDPHLTVVVTGADFAYGEGPAGPQSPVAGRVETLTFKDGDTVLATVSGLNEDPAALLAAIAEIPSDPSAFAELMNTYQFSYDASSVNSGFASAGLFANDDTFIGGGADNAFRGYDGSDTYVGGDGDDAVDYGDESGGSGLVVDLAAGTGTDTFGNSETYQGIEKIWGSAYDDELLGSDGGNLFEGRGGTDLMDGGDGWDTIWYRSEADFGATQGIDANLATGIVLDGFGNTDQVQNIEGVAGTDLADNFVGNGADNDFQGFNGSDSYDGGGGSDAVVWSDENGGQGVYANLATGASTDTFGNQEALISIERLHGSQYNDTFVGSGAGELFEGRGGADDVDGGGGWDTIWYRSEVFFGATQGIDADLLSGIVIDGFGNVDLVQNVESVVGTDFDDIFVGNDVDNDFEGGAGTDSYDGGGGSDAVRWSDEHGGQGVYANLATGVSTDTFGNQETLVSIERLHGSQQADTFIGSDANELFEGRRGDDVIDGGDGWDDLYYRSERFDGGTNGINANLATGVVIDGFGDTDTVSDIESVVGTDFDDTFVGNAIDNDFNGFDGLDSFAGGNGSDAVSFNENFGGSGAVVNLATGVGTDTWGHTESFSSIERLHGSVYDDHFIGSGAHELFEGRRGNDIIDGGGGNDVLYYLSEVQQGGVNGISANLATGFVTDGFGDTDTVSNIESVVGTDFADSFIGDGLDNTFTGNAGEDLVYGGAGVDVIDYRNEEGSAGVVVDLSTGSGTDTHGDTDSYDNIENVRGSRHTDLLTGNAGDNRLEGHDGSDSLAGLAGFDFLNGGEGDDRLDGGAMVDFLNGGNGADTFVFASSAESSDFINDFQAGVDRMEINAAGFAGGLAAGSLDPSYFVSGSGAAANEAGHGQFLYDTDDGNLYWDANGTDGGGVTFVAALNGTPNLTRTDFEIV